MEHLLVKHWLNSHRDFLINLNKHKKLLDHLENLFRYKKLNQSTTWMIQTLLKVCTYIYMENNLFYLDLRNSMKYKIGVLPKLSCYCLEFPYYYFTL